MRNTLLVVSTLLLSSAAQALPQTARVHALTGQGATFGSYTVQGIDDSAIGDDGRWAAILRHSAGGGFARFLVIDGALAAEEGEIRHGARISGFDSVHVSRDGDVCVVYSVDDPNAASTSVRRIEYRGMPVLEEGRSVAVPQAGLLGVLRAIHDAEFQGDDGVVSCTVDTAAGLVRAMLVGGVQGGQFVPTNAVVTGQTLPGHTRPVWSFTGEVDFEPNGRWAASMLQSPGLKKAVTLRGVGLAEEDGAGPDPGSIWTFRHDPRIRTNALGDTILSGTVAHGSAPERGAVYRGTQLLALEGSVTPLVPGDAIAPFETAKVDIDDNGATYFTVPFTSGNDRLIGAGQVLLEENVTEVDGDVVDDLFASIQGGNLEVSGDGRLVLVEARLAQRGATLLVVERSLGEDVPCSVTGNSTGLRGLLEAEGSRYLAENDLRLVARRLPPQQFGLLLTSRDTGFVAGPGGSQGNLCLGGAIGRFNGQIQLTSAAGIASFDADLGALPQPTGDVSALSGQRWVFQVWHRDALGGVNTSNFSAPIAVTIL